MPRHINARGDRLGDHRLIVQHIETDGAREGRDPRPPWPHSRYASSAALSLEALSLNVSVEMPMRARSGGAPCRGISRLRP